MAMNGKIQASLLWLFCRFALCGLLQAWNSELAVAAAPVDDTSFSAKPSPSVIAEWLAQGERKELPWRVHFSKPALEYDQAISVHVGALLPFEGLKKKGANHDLHFIVLVADEMGKWLDGNTYHHQILNIDTSKDLAVTFFASMGFRPGRFRIAAIIFDSITGQRSVMFKRVVISSKQREPSSELFSLFPRVTFDPPWGNHDPSFLVATQRPVQMDIVVEFDSRFVYKKQLHRLTRAGGRFLSAAATLTRMNLENGCVRISGLNSLELGTVIPAQPAGTVDWRSIVASSDEKDQQARTTVGAPELVDKPSTEGAVFFEHHLEQLLADPPCPAASGPPLRVLVIVTGGVDFVKGTNYPKIESQCQCVVFYLLGRLGYQSNFREHVLDDLSAEQSSPPPTINTTAGNQQVPKIAPRPRATRPEGELGDVVPGDGLKGIVKQLSPNFYYFDFDGPMKFQQRFFDLVKVLKNLSSKPPAA
ncbi:MAG TPA: hypothetical protein VKZ53_27595 [Candidatus Angelobacter sp.]|nr:hypothetical protein [Candidatus Angelobacter sp.]